MNAVSPLVAMMMSLFSVLMPGKMWYTPAQPMAMTVTADAKTPVTLVLTHFDGKPFETGGSADAPADGKVADLKTVFPALAEPGTYVLWAVPKGKKVADFVGTPVVIEAKDNKETKAPGVMVYHLEPLRYAVMTTDDGPMTMMFYYDVAPNTVDSFLRLSSEGYYDGLTFHRIVSDFMLQAGDPAGNGGGGPGFTVNQEFNDKKHVEGVLSMARQGSAGEQYGQPPSEHAANSAGSQFFICLNYGKTQGLDGKYTAFGKVVDGEKTMAALKATPVVASEGGEVSKPVKPPVIEKVEVFPVTPGHNPYVEAGLGK
jgi:cyclophilin family peptidyl-prolyl cis-trans isomerase